VSGIGKGTAVSCIGVILKACGYRVTAIKIDPYLNVDAGTMSPTEHGEVFVLDDGGEVDLDLGNYERFLNVTLSKDHNITTGKVYLKIIQDERQGNYLGRTVQVVPHVTDAIQDWIKKVAMIHVGDAEAGGSPARVSSQFAEPDVCLIEIGGTVGDIEGSAYFEAIRQLALKEGPRGLCLGFVSYVPYLSHIGESKTKPTQHGVKELRALGLSPDFILCRSEVELSESAKQKVALFSNLREDRVLSLHNQSSIFYVPELLESQGFSQMVCEIMGLEARTPKLESWLNLAHIISRIEAEASAVHIAIVGKYTGLKDSYLSVIKALEHASYAEKKKLVLDWVDSETLEGEDDNEGWSLIKDAHGILIPGGFGTRGVEGKIRAANYARTHNKPYLGICLGLQIAVIEYARNVLNVPAATSQEFNAETEAPYIVFMPEIDQVKMGGTMRLGTRNCLLKEGSLASSLYFNASVISERHRHRYEVNPDKVGELEAGGLVFSGKDLDSIRMEIIELPSHKFFFGTQFHPEFKSKPFAPSPPFHAFVKASIKEIVS